MLVYSYNAAIFKVVTAKSFDMYTVDVNSEHYKTLSTSNGNTYLRMSNSEWRNLYINQLYLSDNNGDLYLAIDYVATTTNALNNENDYFHTTNLLNVHTPANRDSIAGGPDWITVNGFTPIHANGTSPPIFLNSSVMLHVAEAFSARITDGMSSRIQISLHFMLVVSIFNVLKLVIMFYILRTDRSIYLVTLGDAAASFLATPDPYTYTKCMLGKDEILSRLGVPPDHPISCMDEKEDFDARVSGVWLPRTTRYFYPINSTGKGLYTAL
jgi:hypothetical protein